MTPTDEQVEAAIVAFDKAIAFDLSKPRALELALTAAFSLAAPAGTVSEPWDGLFDCLDDIREKQAERKGAIWDQIHEAREIIRMRWPRSEEDQKIFDLTNKALYSLGGDPINMDLEQATKHLRSAYAALLAQQEGEKR